ncbi:MAG: hypothetical protein KDB03_05030 [Planctomycetales bacterium]|nr:hypothetical protein [Planctomycetales bacterium]
MDTKSLSVEDRAALVCYWLCQRNEQNQYYRPFELKRLIDDPDLQDHDLSRLIKKGKELNYFEQINHLKMGESVRRKVESIFFKIAELESELRRIAPGLKSVSVATAAETDPLTNDQDWDASCEAFGHNAAVPILMPLLSKTSNLGLGMGRTIAACINGIVDAVEKNRPNQERWHTTAFPMWGGVYQETIDRSNTLSSLTIGASASALAERLNRTVNPDVATDSIHGVPSFLPMSWEKVEAGRKQSRRSRFLEDLSAFTAYEKIFGLDVKTGTSTTKPLIEEMDACLVTMGSIHHPTRFYKGDSFYTFVQDKNFQKLFKEHCVGDIGGQFVARFYSDEKKNRAAAKFIRTMEKAYTCVTINHLKSLAKAAMHDTSKTGVIAVVHGSVRAETVLHVLNQKEPLVSHLCLDHHLARTILDIIKTNKLKSNRRVKNDTAKG